MHTTIDKMLTGQMIDADVAAVIVQLRDKGEDADDISQFVTRILAHTRHISTDEQLLDVCGTGGSGLSRFNVSTACAFVLSALGIPVLKHGNKGSQQPNGSFDLLEKLGIPIEQEPELIQYTLKHASLGFVYAKHYHPVLRHVAKGRILAGGRSIFNLAGPLSNPARITYQVIGTADLNTATLLADACIRLGRKRVAVVYGEPGIDEVSISGVSHIYESLDGRNTRYEIKPEDFNIVRTPYEFISSGDVDANAKTFLRLLEADADSSITSMVALNAGLGAYIANRTPSILEGYRMALECIESGKMKKQYNRYKSLLYENRV